MHIFFNIYFLAALSLCCSTQDLLLQCAGFSLAVACGLSCPAACGILAPRPGIEPAPPALGGEVLTTGPPEKSPPCKLLFLKNYLYFIFGCVGSSLLRTDFSLVAANGGLLFTAVHRLLTAVASLVAKHGL